MNIGEVAKASQVTSKMIRRYEEMGIITKASRTSAGYRQYSQNDVHILSFVKHARQLGFSLKDIKQLVSLWKNKNRTSKQVKNIAKLHLEELENKQKEIQAMIGTLKNLVNKCHGDNRPGCPIIENLEKI